MKKTKKFLDKAKLKNISNKKVIEDIRDVEKEILAYKKKAEDDSFEQMVIGLTTMIYGKQMLFYDAKDGWQLRGEGKLSLDDLEGILKDVFRTKELIDK